MLESVESEAGRRKKIVFCWTRISGYMAACWRAFARRGEHDLFVLATSAGPNAIFNQELMAGIDCQLLSEEELHCPRIVREIVVAQRPDVLVVGAWNNPAFVRLPFDRRLASARCVFPLDDPLRRDWRRWIRRWQHARFLRRMDTAWVAGERAWQFARYLGFPERCIRRGVFGIDYEALASLHPQRAALSGGWPRAFLFVGQMTVRKGVDLLLEAYRDYRRRVVDPWPLRCCGDGPLASAASSVEGVEYLGFVQPADMLHVRRTHGVFTFFSRYDPWPLVIAEACAAGLPVICSEACGSSVELVRQLHNGLLVPTGDAGSVADALCWAHRNYNQLPVMGRRGVHLAAAYSADRWADRLLDIVRDEEPLE